MMIPFLFKNQIIQIIEKSNQKQLKVITFQK